MTALLGALFVTSSAHVSAAFDILLPEGSFLFASQKLHQGNIIRISYPASGGVLSVLSHANYSLRVSLSGSGNTGMQWAEAPSSCDGFYSMGPSPIAVVEITAEQDTELFFSGCYVGRACARIVAGHSQSVNFNDIEPKTCFLGTDVMSTLSISGGASSASVVVGTDNGNRVYDGQSASWLSVRPFGFVLVTGDDARDLEIEFYGGDIKYQFDPVTIDSGTGIVGKGAFYSFSQIGELPDAPSAVKVSRPLAVTIITIVVSGLLFCGYFVRVMLRLRRTSRNHSPSPGTLYDRPFDEENDALSSGTDESKPTPPDSLQEPEPPSPYDTL
jgi:hypothetical protein